MMMKTSRNRQTQARLLLVTIVALSIIGGTVIWILNIEGIIGGSWSNIFGVLFTTLGVLFALLQWHSGIPVPHDDSLSYAHIHKEQPTYEDDVRLVVNDQKGALLVKTKKQFRGKTVHISRRFNTIHLTPDAAANIAARRLKGKNLFVGVFPSLEPGNYTVYGDTRQHMAMVTVYAGQITEVDWQ